jgi:hypothetical protein
VILSASVSTFCTRVQSLCSTGVELPPLPLPCASAEPAKESEHTTAIAIITLCTIQLSPS